MKEVIHVGIDVGSTTVKVVVMNEKQEVLYTTYKRHFSDTKNTVCNCLEELADTFQNYDMTIALTGSGALSVSEFLSLPLFKKLLLVKEQLKSIYHKQM